MVPRVLPLHENIRLKSCHEYKLLQSTKTNAFRKWLVTSSQSVLQSSCKNHLILWLTIHHITYVTQAFRKMATEAMLVRWLVILCGIITSEWLLQKWLFIPHVGYISQWFYFHKLAEIMFKLLLILFTQVTKMETFSFQLLSSVQWFHI